MKNILVDIKQRACDICSLIEGVKDSCEQNQYTPQQKILENILENCYVLTEKILLLKEKNISPDFLPSDELTNGFNTSE